jgi:hypothetical protein
VRIVFYVGEKTVGFGDEVRDQGRAARRGILHIMKHEHPAVSHTGRAWPHDLSEMALFGLAWWVVQQFL